MENNLPKGWVKVNFTDVLDVQGGTQPPKSTFVYSPRQGYIQLLQIRDFGEKPHPTFIPIKSTLKFCKKDDILIARYGASLGRIVTGFEGAYNVALAKVIIPDVLDKGYVRHLLKSEIFQRPILANERSAQDGFNKDDLAKIDIPIAPLSEQQRIVAKLDELMDKIDRSRARLERIPKILKRFRQSILSAAVSGKLTEEWRARNKTNNEIFISDTFSINEEYKLLFDLPDGWKWVALGNYVKCNRGRFSIRPRNDPRYFSGKIPFIQIGDLPREGGFINEHTQTLNNEGLKVSKMFPKNTVAIAIVGATIGNTGILSYDMCFTDSMVGINTGDLKSNLFIEYYLRSEKENLRQLSYAGGGQPNIKLELLNAYPFPLPSIEEQNEIVSKVEILFAVADKIEARYIKAKAQVDKVPQSLLAKAFRGELVSQDENDEPASVLLERMQSSKTNKIKV